MLQFRHLCTKNRVLLTSYTRRRCYSTIWDAQDNGDCYGVISGGSPFQWTNQPHSHYLSNNPVGPYTVCRTVQQRHIFQFEMHIDRLIHTIYENYKLRYHVSTAPALCKSVLYDEIYDTLSNGLASFYDKIPADEARIMIYLNEDHLFDKLNQECKAKDLFSQCMIVHFCELPTLKKPIRAIVRSPIKGGKDAMAKLEHSKKDSQWFSDRKEWQNPQVDNALQINEVLMCDASTSSILEGVSSSFAVLKHEDHSTNLYVPSLNDGVLDGTVRRFIIDVLGEEKYQGPIKLVYGVPKLNDIKEWQGCMLMSTTRMLLPVDELYIDMHRTSDPQTLECIQFDNQSNTHLKEFQMYVNQQILHHSTLIHHHKK